MRRLPLAALAASAALFAASAEAHFVLKTPASWNSQDFLGNPQKLGPCGDDGGTPTGAVTTVTEGDTITVSIDETIYHPGHYRIALSVKDRSELPAEPIVTPGATACGSTTIEDPPKFPVLADGVFLHTKPFSGTQTVQVKLPAGVTCDKCTLQVIQFMSDHALNNPGGCYYHHCADLKVVPAGQGTGGSSGTGGAGTSGSPTTGGSSGSSTSAGGSSTSAGGSSTSAGGSSTSAGGSSSGATGASAAPSEDDGGCSCTVPHGSGGGAALFAALFAVGELARRTRRR